MILSVRKACTEFDAAYREQGKKQPGNETGRVKMPPQEVISNLIAAIKDALLWTPTQEREDQLKDAAVEMLHSLDLPEDIIVKCINEMGI